MRPYFRENGAGDVLLEGGWELLKRALEKSVPGRWRLCRGATVQLAYWRGHSQLCFSRVWTSECLGHHCLGSCLKCTFLNKQTKMLMVLPIESDSWWEQSPESVLRGSTWVWLMKCKLVGGDTGRCNSATIEGGPDAGLGPGRKKQSLKGHGVHGLYDYLEGGLWPEAPESGLSSH